MTDGDDGTKAAMAADEGTISTTYGEELSAQLVIARIPFSTTYEIEPLTTFHVDPTDQHHTHELLKLMSMVRQTKLR